MGWASRARQAEARRELHRYRVRRWTAFEFPAGETAREAQAREVRERSLERIRVAVGRKLTDVAPDCDASVKRVRIKGAPQLMFELTVDAPNREAAKGQARYLIGKALLAKVPTAMGGRVSLRPPWGRMEALEQRDQRTLRVAEPQD